MYLHEILAEALYCGSLPVDLQIFPRYIEDLYQTDSNTGKSHMEIQYEVINRYFILTLKDPPIICSRRQLQI